MPSKLIGEAFPQKDRTSTVRTLADGNFVVRVEQLAAHKHGERARQPGAETQQWNSRGSRDESLRVQQ